jgi:dephospho-CoA kinase
VVERDLDRAPDRAPVRRSGVVAIGLTGGIGAGKSTALSMFRELGAFTTSADQMVHELYARPDYIGKLAEHFGGQVLDERGGVDRRRMARLVKGRREELHWLEQLTHPLVEIEIKRVVDEAAPRSVVVCEVPLLFESHFEGLFDLVVTVEAEREKRVSRSAHRFEPGVFDEFEGLQASTEQRVSGSDMAYYNDDSLDHMRAFVREAYGRAVALVGRQV